MLKSNTTYNRSDNRKHRNLKLKETFAIKNWNAKTTCCIRNGGNDVQAQTMRRSNKTVAKRINEHNMRLSTVGLQRRGIYPLDFRVLLEQTRHLAPSSVCQGIGQIPTQIETQIRNGRRRSCSGTLDRRPRGWTTLFRFLRISIRVLWILVLFPFHQTDSVCWYNGYSLPSIVLSTRLYHDGSCRIAFAYYRIPKRYWIILSCRRSGSV